MIRDIFSFVGGSARLLLQGNRWYFAWVTFLGVLIVWGVTAWIQQLNQGLIVTNMRDQVSWAFYIGNFTFLVGVAAAAVMLVIPAYIYDWKPIKEIAIFGELLAVSAIVMCMLFVLVDVGTTGPGMAPDALLRQPEPAEFVAGMGRAGAECVPRPQPRHRRSPALHRLPQAPLPAAVCGSVAPVLDPGRGRNPHRHRLRVRRRGGAAVLELGHPRTAIPRFGLLFRPRNPSDPVPDPAASTTSIEIKDEAIWKIAELMAYAMFLNLFLFGAEIFREYYSNTHHLIHTQYLFSGIDGHRALVPFAWASLIASVIAFLLFLVPATRRNLVTLNLGCLLIYSGVYIEKGMALVIPGMTPDTLGELYEYVPTLTEVRVGAGIFAIGFLVFTLLCKIAIPILQESEKPVGPEKPQTEVALP